MDRAPARRLRLGAERSRRRRPRPARRSCERRSPVSAAYDSSPACASWSASSRNVCAGVQCRSTASPTRKASAGAAVLLEDRSSWPHGIRDEVLRADADEADVADRAAGEPVACRRRARCRARPRKTFSGPDADPHRPVGTTGARHRAHRACCRARRRRRARRRAPTTSAVDQVGLAEEVRDERGRRASRRAPPARPAARSRPLFITAMVSAIVMASSWSWVTCTKVMPTSVWIRLSSICICRRSLRSSAPSGSSSSSTCGRLISARASATRCCWPPESWAGRRLP